MQRSIRRINKSGAGVKGATSGERSIFIVHFSYPSPTECDKLSFASPASNWFLVRKRTLRP